mmetsp:Transcript_14620/g.34706  ORF Transcript_14620/g.34706 Transcript_14620/m.34706 type:complete len:579 (+) Transcript_14620:2600-4336(+)
MFTRPSLPCCASTVPEGAPTRSRVPTRRRLLQPLIRRCRGMQARPILRPSKPSSKPLCGMARQLPAIEPSSRGSMALAPSELGLGPCAPTLRPLRGPAQLQRSVLLVSRPWEAATLPLPARASRRPCQKARDPPRQTVFQGMPLVLIHATLHWHAEQYPAVVASLRPVLTLMCAHPLELPLLARAHMSRLMWHPLPARDWGAAGRTPPTHPRNIALLAGGLPLALGGRETHTTLRPRKSGRNPVQASMENGPACGGLRTPGGARCEPAPRAAPFAIPPKMSRQPIRTDLGALVRMLPLSRAAVMAGQRSWRLAPMISTHGLLLESGLRGRTSKLHSPRARAVRRCQACLRWRRIRRERSLHPRRREATLRNSMQTCLETQIGQRGNKAVRRVGLVSPKLGAARHGSLGRGVSLWAQSRPTTISRRCQPATGPGPAARQCLSLTECMMKPQTARALPMVSAGLTPAAGSNPGYSLHRAWLGACRLFRHATQQQRHHSTETWALHQRAVPLATGSSRLARAGLQDPPKWGQPDPGMSLLCCPAGAGTTRAAGAWATPPVHGHLPPVGRQCVVTSTGPPQQ